MKTLENVKNAGLKFCQDNNFNPANANLAHDACHTVSGYPATVEGEQLQAGWELAVMRVNPKGHLTDLEIEGFLVGCEFIEQNQALAELLCKALETL